MKLTLQEIGETFNEQDIAYAEKWRVEAAEWVSHGVYEAICRLIDPKEGQTIVDIGAGANADQLLYLFANVDNATLIGTERGQALPLLAAASLERHKVPALTCVGCSIEQNANGQYYWHYRSPGQDQLDLIHTELKKGRVGILADDIRYPTVLPALLGKQQIDALNFSMPGGSASRVFEWPQPEITEAISDAALESRIVEITTGTRLACFHFASEHVKPKGKLVLSERMTFDPTITLKRLVAIFQEMLGSYAEYWESDKVTVTDPLAVHSGLDWFAQSKGGTTVRQETSNPEKVPTFASMIAFRRNDKEFTKEPLSRPDR